MAQRERCRGTGKVIFATYDEAFQRLGEIGMLPGASFYRPTQVTRRCQSCDGYHLSSKPNKPWRSGKQTVARRNAKKGLTNRRRSG